LKNIRIYVSLPTEADPVPTFVLQNLASKSSTFVRIERTQNGPGGITVVGESAPRAAPSRATARIHVVPTFADSKPSYLERTELVHAVVGIVSLEVGKLPSQVAIDSYSRELRRSARSTHREEFVLMSLYL
jgi:hypothetical protein